MLEKSKLLIAGTDFRQSVDYDGRRVHLAVKLAPEVGHCPEKVDLEKIYTFGLWEVLTTGANAMIF
jgi:hypothetical protein